MQSASNWTTVHFASPINQPGDVECAPPHKSSSPSLLTVHWSIPNYLPYVTSNLPRTIIATMPI
ncbi:hypothetical protein TSUD_298660 [Trifolium subterraneum]|nr:hypothetical protein TSUD_298660 [Trifolium subterraneum]